ncbi:transmembrane protein 116 [Archocentrus centrarchus]|uniref:transmembrane protein 116 n=1 Tax=Archocentrus centrarchus TaxID=63155 RepID=UPI0011E9C420|nr:transmembrane protein 116 [Archocentrus centrarchus]
MGHSNAILVANDTAKNTTGAHDWTEVYSIVRWIQLVMAVLSILGSGSIISCLMLRRLSRKPELQPLFLLSIADLLLAVCWLIGAILFSQDCSGRSMHCYNLHIVEQIFYMASFFYTLNYVWNLYKGIREKYYSCMDGYPVQVSNRVSTAGKVLALVSCLLPVLLMMPVIIEGNLSQCQANFSEPFRCLMMHTGALFLVLDHQPIIPTCNRLNTYHITVFLITVVFTLLSITVLVVKARCIYRRIVTSNGYLGSEQRASFSEMDRRMVLYPSIFVFCWGPAVTLAFLRVVDPSVCQGKAGVVLYISQALTSASQGFLNCLVYGWTRVHLRRAGRSVLSRDVDTQTPLLRAQRNRGYQTLRTIA